MSTTYEVLARKWRPQQFDEVIGQGHVTQTLKNAITSERVAQAYLFVGPRGVGKTTLARIMAKALDCQKGPTTTPCDKCDACREIMAGNCLDVMEIDGASNTGVDNVRELRENVKYLPARGPYKIYVIDEVHMLSMGAFNALLKTLEEPPPHVKFVFATTEVQKIPATILSRCQRFDLRRISTKDIVSHLATISKAEGVQIDEDALLAIARGAEGGLRDAESALDQLIAFRGRKIAESDVLSVFGLVARQTLEELALAVLRGDVAKMLDIMAELDAAGKDVLRLTAELLEYFRNLLVVAYAGDSAAVAEMPDAQRAALQKVAQGLHPSRVLDVVDILIEVNAQIRYALSRRTILEVALCRAARAATTVAVDEILRQLNQLKEALGGDDEPLARPAAAPPPEDRRGPVPAHAAPAPAGGFASDLMKLNSRWRDIVEKVGRLSMAAKNCLLDAKPVEVAQERVTIGFDPEFASGLEQMSAARNQKSLSLVLEEALGRPVAVDYRLLDKGATVLPSDVRPEVAEGGEGGPAAGPKTKKQWVKDPAVKRALETFHGDIIDVREQK